MEAHYTVVFRYSDCADPWVLWMVMDNQLYGIASVCRRTDVDLKPGMTTNEVLFRKGEPNQKPENGFWFYMKNSDTIGHVVRIKNGRVRYIQAVTKEGEEYNLPTVQGVSHYSSQEDIEKRFGKPDNASIYKDHTRRFLSYMRLGLAFELERNQVISIGVFDRTKPIKYEDEAALTTPCLSEKKHQMLRNDQPGWLPLSFMQNPLDALLALAHPFVERAPNLKAGCDGQCFGFLLLRLFRNSLVPRSTARSATTAAAPSCFWSS